MSPSSEISGLAMLLFFRLRRAETQPSFHVAATIFPVITVFFLFGEFAIIGRSAVQ